MRCLHCGELFLETIGEVIEGQALFCPACDTCHVFHWLSQELEAFSLTQCTTEGRH